MEKMRQLQMQVRQNQQEVGDFIKDLDTWTTDIKKQDESLKSMRPSQKAESKVPPIRSKVIVEKVKKKKKEDVKRPERIKSSDYRKWEKLDVDAMLKQVDDEEREIEEEIQTEVDKLDQTRRTKVAAEMKEKGNEHFKHAGYAAAIECYTTGMQADPSNPVFPANRAMAYLKLKKYVETEADCTLALSLDPTYTKAYLRRGTARTALAKISSARKDFQDALRLEPGNVQAKTEIKKLDELERIDKKPKTETPKTVENGLKKKSKFVKPIYIPPKLRSKKPLVRVEVQEIGFTEKETPTNENIDLDFLLNKSNGTRGKPENSTISNKQADSNLLERNSGSNSVKKKILVQEIKNDMSEGFAKQNGVDHSNENGDNCSIGKRTTPQNHEHSEGGLKPSQNSIPACPTTSFQFQAAVKQLANDPKLLFSYILQIPPSQIPALLKQQLETETLIPVLKSFYNCSNGDEIVVDYLNRFTMVKRFEMAVMFMSDQEKKDVRSVFQHLETILPSRKVDVALLYGKYGL